MRIQRTIIFVLWISVLLPFEMPWAWRYDYIPNNSSNSDHYLHFWKFYYQLKQNILKYIEWRSITTDVTNSPAFTNLDNIWNYSHLPTCPPQNTFAVLLDHLHKHSTKYISKKWYSLTVSTFVPQCCKYFQCSSQSDLW